MFGKSGRTSQIAAWTLLSINFILMTCCVLLFAFSLWTIASPNSLTSAIKCVGSDVMSALLPPQVLTVQLGVSTAVLATFVFFISFMGFYGACTRSQFLLFMYAILVFLLLLLEYALIYYYSSNLIEKGFQYDDGQLTHVLRVAFHCCEHNTTSNQGASKPPWSCCGTPGYPDNCTSSQVFNEDCRTAITKWLNRYQTAIYVSLAAFHIILSSCSLLRRSRSASRSNS